MFLADLIALSPSFAACCEMWRTAAAAHACSAFTRFHSARSLFALHSDDFACFVLLCKQASVNIYRQFDKLVLLGPNGELLFMWRSPASLFSSVLLFLATCLLRRVCLRRFCHKMTVVPLFLYWRVVCSVALFCCHVMVRF